MTFFYNLVDGVAQLGAVDDHPPGVPEALAVGRVGRAAPVPVLARRLVHLGKKKKKKGEQEPCLNQYAWHAALSTVGGFELKEFSEFQTAWRVLKQPLGIGSG